MDAFLFITGIIMVLLFVGFIIAIPIIGTKVDTEEEKAKNQLEKNKEKLTKLYKIGYEDAKENYEKLIEYLKC